LPRVTSLPTPSPLPMPYIIDDSPIEECPQICTNGGDERSNIVDDDLILGHPLPMISPYGLG